MPIQFHPEPGTILVCDFKDLEPPEMCKRRPVIVLSPRLKRKSGFCTVAPFSTTDPWPPAAYHYRLRTSPRLPEPYTSEYHWIKADMLYTVSFKRLYLMSNGKDSSGNRIYDVRVVSDEDLRAIRACVLHGIGLPSLTQHL